MVDDDKIVPPDYPVNEESGEPLCLESCENCSFSPPPKVHPATFISAGGFGIYKAVTQTTVLSLL